MKYKEPEYGSKMFSCPNCGALAQQEWQVVEFGQDFIPGVGWKEENPRIARCLACGKKSFWSNGALVYPQHFNVLEPNADMPEEVLELYYEASAVAGLSPRSACALLRLALVKLFVSLKVSMPGGNVSLDDPVFPEPIREAMGIVGIAGDRTIPAGKIQLEGDTFQTAAILFDILNLIVEYNISSKRKVNDLYLLFPHHPDSVLHK